MTVLQQAVTIAAVAAGTVFTRFVSFAVFPAGRKPPAFVTYLGGVLPYAIMAFLVVLALRGVSPLEGSHGVPEALACLAVVGVHLRWRNTLLSIAAGTAVYMVLLRAVFA